MLRGECFHVVRPKFATVLRPQAIQLPYLNSGSQIMISDNMKQTLGLSHVSGAHVDPETGTFPPPRLFTICNKYGYNR
jgi:hypothetical protein